MMDGNLVCTFKAINQPQNTSNMFGANIFRFQNMQFFTSSDSVEGGFENVCTRMCLLDFEILTFSTLFFVPIYH